jgi:hypothetical protein
MAVSDALRLKDAAQKDFLRYLKGDGLCLRGGGALRHAYGSPRMTPDLNFHYEGGAAKRRALSAAERMRINFYSVSFEDGDTARIRLTLPVDMAANVMDIEMGTVPVYMKTAVKRNGFTLTVPSASEIMADDIAAVLNTFDKSGGLNFRNVYDIAYAVRNLRAKPDRCMVSKKLDDRGMLESKGGFKARKVNDFMRELRTQRRFMITEMARYMEPLLVGTADAFAVDTVLDLMGELDIEGMLVTSSQNEKAP